MDGEAEMGIKFDIGAGDSVKDREERVWVWDRIHNIIGYFHGDDYDFCIVNRYKDDSFDGLSIHLNGNIIYIVSQKKGDILTYDIEKDFFQLYKSGIEQKTSQYYSVQINQSKLILFSYELKYDSILFDIQKKQFRKISLLETDSYKDKTIAKMSITENEIIIGLSDSNEILIFDKKDMHYSSKKIPYIDAIGGICADNIQDIWAISKNGDCYVRSRTENDVLIKTGKKKEEDLFSKLVKYGNYVVAIPRYASELYIYNILKKEITTVKVPKLEEVPVNGASLFFGYFFKKNKLVLLPWRYPQMLELDMDTLLVRTCMADVTGKEFCKFFFQEVTYESKKQNVSFLMEIAGEKKKKVAGQDCLGTKIWNNLNVSS